MKLYVICLTLISCVVNIVVESTTTSGGELSSSSVCGASNKQGFFGSVGSLCYDEETTRNIVREQFIGRDDLPWIVSLKDYRYHSPRHFCTGIIATVQWILTTAYCVVNYQIDDFRVVAGDSDFTISSGHEQIRKAAQVVIHEDSKIVVSDLRTKDVALVRIEEPIELSNRIQVVTFQPVGRERLVGERCVSYGWGMLYGYNALSPFLKESNVTIISDVECKRIYNWNSIFDQILSICAMATSINGPCTGDWGGPLVCNDQLVAMASWSNGCSSTKYPVVFVELSKFQDWIETTIERENYLLVTDAYIENDPGFLQH